MINVTTSGGEFWNDDTKIDEYTLSIDIFELKSERLIQIATDILNHLMVNGHKFEIGVANHQDRYPVLNYKGHD